MNFQIDINPHKFKIPIFAEFFGERMKWLKQNQCSLLWCTAIPYFWFCLSFYHSSFSRVTAQWSITLLAWLEPVVLLPCCPLLLRIKGNLYKLLQFLMFEAFKRVSHEAVLWRSGVIIKCLTDCCVMLMSELSDLTVCKRRTLLDNVQ